MRRHAESFENVTVELERSCSISRQVQTALSSLSRTLAVKRGRSVGAI